MRKTRKIVTSIFCSMLLITSAISVTAASPYAVVKPCTECRVGSVTRTTTRVYEHDETFPCPHTGVGDDRYAVYHVTIRENCNNCSYSYTDSYEEHELLYCNAN